MAKEYNPEWNVGLIPVEDRNWRFIEEDFRLDKVGHYETLFTLANGYVGSRGAMEYGLHYGLPGTFFAGVFDAVPQHFSEISNAPNWNIVNITIDGVFLDLRKMKVLGYQRVLDMRQGILFHHVRFEDARGWITQYESAKLVHASRRHNALIWGRLTAENWSGPVTFDSGIFGDVYNTTMKYQVKVKHFPDLECGAEKDGVLYAKGTTPVTKVTVAVLVKTDLDREAAPDLRYGRETISLAQTVNLEAGQSVEFTKTAAFATSRDTENPLDLARKELKAALKAGKDKLIQEHVREWDKRWSFSDIVIEGDNLAQRSLRFNLFHLMQLGNPWDGDVSIGAKGLHGEGYRGHAFWDTEIFMTPFFIYNNPAVARNQLMYRYNRLPAARQNAKADQYKGAKFPWESADTGLDVMPYLEGDFITGENVTPRGWECQHHITADVAYGVMHYVTATGDREFYEQYGAQILIETAQFWSSRAEWDKRRKAWVIREVMGPDELHNKINNSVYTNHIAGWNLKEGLRAVKEMKQFAPARWKSLRKELGITEEELRRWKEVSENLWINYNPKTKLFEQFEGYFKLEDLTVTYGENGRPIIHRDWWPKLPKTQLLKQADVVLMTYLFSDQFDLATKRANFDYYEPRTTHLSSLSPNTYAIVGIEIGEYERAYRSFMMSATVDIHEHAHVPDGIHAASLGGTWMVAVAGFGGLRVQDGHMTFRPWLPPEWKSLTFRLLWQGTPVLFKVTPKTFTAVTEGKSAKPVRIRIFEDWHEVDRKGITVQIKR